MTLGKTPFADALSSALEGRAAGDAFGVAKHAPLLESLYREYRGFRGQSVDVLFSGGLDTSFLAHFLQTMVGANVTAISVDVGSILPEGNGSLERARKRAAEIGVPFRSLDGHPFLLEPFLACVRAEAQLFRGHHPASSLSRTAIVRSVLDFARSDPPYAIVHGSNGFQNNAFRFFNAFKHYGHTSHLSIIVAAPHLDAPFSREIAEWYLAGMGIPTARHDDDVIYSQDDNIFGMEAEDASIAVPSHAFDVEETLLRGLLPAGDHASPAFVSIAFRDGVPVGAGVDDRGMRELQPLEVLGELNRVGLRYGIGVHDYYEGRPIGMHVREVHVAPGMTLLTRARHLLRITLLPPELSRQLERLSQLWTELVVVANLWTHPLRREADAVFLRHSEGLTGTVTLRLRDRCADLPTVHPAHGNLATREKEPATAADVASLYELTHERNDGCSAPSDDEEIRRLCTEIDEVVHSTYRFFSSQRSNDRPERPRSARHAEPTPLV